MRSLLSTTGTRRFTNLAIALRAVGTFLLELDPEKKQLRVTPFTGEDVALASEKYLEVEREIEKNPKIEAVLVRGDSIAALRKAYPNYYADMHIFLNALNRILENGL